MISDKLKKIIFDKLYKDLFKVEIIPYNDNLWFIDREHKYWYFELKKDGTLWWRYEFFNDFFSLFSFERDKFEPIIKDWVEEVLNHRVNTTMFGSIGPNYLVEEVLNHRVNTTTYTSAISLRWVEEVLNHKVSKTVTPLLIFNKTVEKALNHSFVNKTIGGIYRYNALMDEILNHKVGKTFEPEENRDWLVEKIINYKVTNIDGGEMIDEENTVNEVLDSSNN